MSKKPLAIGWVGLICLLMCMMFSGKAQAQTPWLDSLYVRVADAEVLRPSGGDAVVVFNLEVFRPVKEWNNNDTTLGASDFVFGKSGNDLMDIFKEVQVKSLHSQITSGTTAALRLEGRFVLGKLQISLTEVEGTSQNLELPYREWVKLCRVELPLKNPSTVELGVVWDTTSTGLVTKNIPILEVLMDDLDKIPDKVLTFEDYASSQTICSGEEFFLFAHAMSSGEDLSCTWQYSVDNGTTFTSLNSYAPNWGNATGGAGFQYRVKGEHTDTLWLRGVTTNLSGIIFKCVAQDLTVSSDKRETPAMVLKVLPEVQVALEGYASPGDFQANLGISGDTVRRCPGEKGIARVAFYGIQNSSQLSNLKGMGGKVYIAYRWIDKLGGSGRDTLKVNMSDIAKQNISWNSGFVLTSDKLQLELAEDGKYYIHKVWTDSCNMGTVLSAYDTVVVHQSSNVLYEFDPIDYIAKSPAIDITKDLDFTFTSIEVKAPSIGNVLNGYYDTQTNEVGTDTILYTYKSGACEVTASRLIHVLSSKSVAIKVFLEGPYVASADSMRCINEGYFNATANEYLSPYEDNKICPKPLPGFDRKICDWVYVEVWDYPPKGTSLADTKKGQLMDATSAFLLSDGTVASLDGKKYLSFDKLPGNKYYILVKHRNHMDVLSAKEVQFTTGTIPTAVNTIDFTQKMENAFDISGSSSLQTPLKGISGKCVMYGGYLSGTGRITVNDLKKVILKLSKTGYLDEDLNFDGRVNFMDQKMVNANLSIYIKY